MIICGFKYEAGYMDYMLFEMYNLNSKQRKTIMTRGKNNKLIKKYNDFKYKDYFLMKDKFDNIIYVGKAKILKNRVRQYFQSSKNHSSKVKSMVKNIDKFEYIITDSELEALILECNLIKKYKPKYNVLLRDDKTYPYIKVTTNEDFPRVLKVRKVIKDKAKYFGPYTNTTAVNDTLDIIKNIYPIRTCNIDIERAIKTNMRPCLNLHIKRCVGPCTGNVTKEEYNKMIEEIILFLLSYRGVFRLLYQKHR